MANETKITIISKNNTLKGKRGEAVATILRTKTVGGFRASLEKKGLAGYASWALRVAQENGLVKLEA